VAKEKEKDKLLEALEGFGLELDEAEELVDGLVKFRAAKTSDVAQLNAIFIEQFQFSIDYILENIYQSLHFCRRAFPVLRRESVDCKILDSVFRGGFNDAAQVINTSSVSCHARQSARARPTTVAIHNDGNVLRDFLWKFNLRFVCHRLREVLINLQGPQFLCVPRFH